MGDFDAVFSALIVGGREACFWDEEVVNSRSAI